MCAPKLSFCRRVVSRRSLVVWQTKPSKRLATNDQRLFYFLAVAFLLTAFFFAGAFALTFAFGFAEVPFADFSPAAAVVPVATGAPFRFFSARTISRCEMRRT